MTITIPDDLAALLHAEAKRQGVSTDELVLKSVQQAVANELRPAEGESNGEEGSLYDRLKGQIGLVEGSGEPWSIDCGRKFADDLVAGRRARP